MDVIKSIKASISVKTATGATSYDLNRILTRPRSKVYNRSRRSSDKVEHANCGTMLYIKRMLDVDLRPDIGCRVQIGMGNQLEKDINIQL